MQCERIALQLLKGRGGAMRTGSRGVDSKDPGGFPVNGPAGACGVFLGGRKKDVCESGREDHRDKEKQKKGFPRDEFHQIPLR